MARLWSRRLTRTTAKPFIVSWIGETLKRATQVANVSQKFRDQYSADTLAAIQADGDALVKIAEMVQAGARFSYHRCARQGIDRVAQFRRILPDGSFDFFTILLRKKSDRAVVGIDLKSLNMGDYFSLILRPTFLAAASAVDNKLAGRLSSADREYVKSLDDLLAMNKLVGEGKNAEAIKTFDKLPAKVQHMRSTQLVRVAAAQRSGDEKSYFTVMEDFLAKFPDDPSVDYLSIDFHFLRGNLDDSIAALDRIAASVGGDAYLDVMKTNVLIKKGDLAAARKTITAARNAEPSLIETYWTSITVALAEKDFAAVAQLLDGIAKRFHRDFNDLGTISEFAEFVASPEGKAWQKSYAEAKSAAAAQTDAKDK